MAHEITSIDGVVLHGQRAWHGLGTVVSDAPTPSEALKIAGLDWEVEQWPVYATAGDKRLVIPNTVCNVRSDTNTDLGIVSTGYKPYSNRELASFCESLAEQGDVVKLESAGSIRGGRKVWFLLKGESFSVRDEDEVTPYICASNGHDGTAALRLTMTSVRVVCSNTLHMVIPSSDNEAGRRFNQGKSQYVTFHNGDLDKKLAAAKAALKLYGYHLKATHDAASFLATREVTRKQVQDFFLECYSRDFEAIPANPQDAAQQKARDKASIAFNFVAARFDAELKLAGPTRWNMFNAYSGWLQNDRGRIYKDQKVAHERRVATKLFGVDTERTSRAFATALSV